MRALRQAVLAVVVVSPEWVESIETPLKNFVVFACGGCVVGRGHWELAPQRRGSGAVQVVLRKFIEPESSAVEQCGTSSPSRDAPHESVERVPKGAVWARECGGNRGGMPSTGIVESACRKAWLDSPSE